MSSPSWSSPKPSTFGRRPVATSSRSASIGSPADTYKRTPRARGLDALRLDGDPHVDALLLEALAKERSGIGVEPRENPVVVLDHGHPSAHAVEELRELDADGATAEHDQALRDSIRPDGVPVRPVVDVLEPFDPRYGRRRPGRDHEVRVLDLMLLHCDDTGTDDTGVASHELGALILEPAGVPGVVAPVGHLIAPPQHPLDVQLAGDPLRRAWGKPRRRECLGRAQERLGRKTGVVRALAAGELPLDDDDLDARVEPTQGAHEVLAGRAGSQHHDTTTMAHHRVTPFNGETGSDLGAKRLVREADQWRESGGTGRFPQQQTPPAASGEGGI